MKRMNRFWTLTFWNRHTHVPVDSCPTRQRLAKSFSNLQSIEMIRDQLQDPRFERATERRIVWRELVELELQDVDEQIERIMHVARDGSDTP